MKIRCKLDNYVKVGHKQKQSTIVNQRDELWGKNKSSDPLLKVGH